MNVEMIEGKAKRFFSRRGEKPKNETIQSLGVQRETIGKWQLFGFLATAKTMDPISTVLTKDLKLPWKRWSGEAGNFRM